MLNLKPFHECFDNDYPIYSVSIKFSVDDIFKIVIMQSIRTVNFTFNLSIIVYQLFVNYLFEK